MSVQADTEMAVCRTHFTPEGYPKGTVCRICSPLLHLSSATYLCLASDLTSTSRLNLCLSVASSSHISISMSTDFRALLQTSLQRCGCPRALSALRRADTWGCFHLVCGRHVQASGVCAVGEHALDFRSSHPHTLSLSSEELLPPDSSEAWSTWSSLNRLRTETGRCKALMQKWGYNEHGQTVCECGDERTKNDTPAGLPHPATTLSGLPMKTWNSSTPS